MGILNWLFNKKPKEAHLPAGWSETRISDSTFLVDIPEASRQKWEDDRREKDKVEKLQKKDGFYLKQDGRSGTIYYVNLGRVCEVYFENAPGVSGYDILVNFHTLKKWFYPSDTIITPQELDSIKEKLSIWLKEKKLNAEID